MIPLSYRTNAHSNYKLMTTIYAAAKAQPFKHYVLDAYQITTNTWRSMRSRRRWPSSGWHWLWLCLDGLSNHMPTFHVWWSQHRDRTGHRMVQTWWMNSDTSWCNHFHLHSLHVTWNTVSLVRQATLTRTNLATNLSTYLWQPVSWN
jgi:hypothetical protein